MKGISIIDNEPHVVIPLKNINELRGLMNNDLLTLTELCEQILHVNRQTANDNWVYRPDFPHVKIHGRRYYPRQTVNDYLDRLSKGY
ncbi:MAG: helix-turn-helix domain-containing protein [Aerococcus sp.]|nr:helix-turn-helix domain-containing protein [Aerococcus sp.]